MEIKKKDIDNIFKKAEHQTEALDAVYRLVLPKWDKIKTSKGFPMIGDKGWCYICQKFIDLDKEKHDKTFPGGLWMSKGFGQSDYLQDWQVDFNHFYPKYI